MRSLQSGNIAFLLGSGASFPAIPTAGAIEAEIAELLASNRERDAYDRLYEFLVTVQEPTNKLVSDNFDESVRATLGHYEDLLRTIEEILLARRTNLLPRQVTIFSTNYDLFVERGCAACPTVILNDGFSRAPGLGWTMEYSSRNFFRTLYSVGNLYDYRVEIPCVNLIKLHGSMSWSKQADTIALAPGQRDPILGDTFENRKTFSQGLAVVLPQASKFRETLMDRTYYDLLRIYANHLDRENTLLLSFGFSFSDEHIRDITTRALKNPTLRMMIFAFDTAARDSFARIFDKYSNVEIVWSPSMNLDFAQFNQALKHVLHAPPDTR